MMTLNKAKTLALQTVAILLGRAVVDLLVVDELTQCRRIGWIFLRGARLSRER